MNHNPMVDWPHQSLVNGFPSLQTGRVVLFEGSSNVNEWLLLSVAANELQDGRAVYWIDGGTRFDPGRFVPLIRAGRIETEECMQRMYVCRGFTAHQLSEQIHSVCNNLEIKNIQQENDTRLLVISDMPMMYGDGQIRIEEGCSMLRRALLLLQRIAMEQSCLILLSHRSSRQHPFSWVLRNQLYAVVDERFVCAHERKSGVMKATWCKGWKSIKWNPNETMQMRLDAFNQHQSESTGILDTPLETWCSSHPKAERIAEIERNAIGT